MLRLFQHKRWHDAVIVVSGLPRSGTSLMMQMLVAGGVDLLIDNKRAADLNNPRGYYEYDPVKRLADGDNVWLRSAQSKGVKIVSPLLQYLPTDLRYRIIFMRRHIAEIAASQRTMLETVNQLQSGTYDSHEEYEHHLLNVQRWLQKQSHVRLLNVHYSHLLKNPEQECGTIADFLQRPLDTEAMQHVIDPSLYRHKQHM